MRRLPIRPALRRRPALLLAALLGVLLARDAHALSACTAADVSMQDPSCPAGAGPCTITKVFTVGDGCLLDFRPRGVTIAGSGLIDIASGMVTLKAASLTLAPGGHIDGRGTASSLPGSRGGMLVIETTGDVTIQKGATVGTIDVSGKTQGGHVLLQAGGTVTVAGRIVSDQLDPGGSGGVISIRAGGDIVTLAGSTLSATGGTRGSGGDIDFLAAGRVSLGDALTVSGGDGGVVDVNAAADAIIRRIEASATGEAGSGGCVDLAGTGLQLLGAVTSNGSSSSGFGGGCGGFLFAEARFGDISVAANVVAEGAAPDGGGGDIDFDARGSIDVGAAATVSVRGIGDQGCGGEIALSAGLDAAVRGALDTSGGFGGNFLDVIAGRDVTLSGPLRLNGRSAGGFGGGAIISAGEFTTGRLSLSNTLDVTGGGCSQLFGCGLGGTADLSGCTVTITSAGALLASGPDGGENVITARDQLTLEGRVIAAGSSSGSPGANRIVHRSDRPPQVSGTVTPAALVQSLPACSASGQSACLLPCPTCGDGVLEFPETCDSLGQPQSCDGCSLFCRTEDASCDDGNACTIDRCAPALGCQNERIPGCPATTTTTTRPPTTTTTTTRPTTTTLPTTTTTSPTTTTTSPTTTTTSPTLPTTTTSTTTATSTTTTSSTRPPSTTTSSTRPPSTTTTATTSPSTTATSSSTTSSTVSPPTSTTTLAPNPCVPADCNDGDPCTEDACTPEGCRHESVADGVASATCIFQGAALHPTTCASPLPLSVSRPFDQARSLLERSGQAPSPKKARALVRKAVKALRKGGKSITKAMKKRAIGPDCGAALGRAQAEALRRAEALL